MTVLWAALELPWPEFVARWCLGVEPDHSPIELRESLLAVERHWPERLDELERRGTGLGYLQPVIRLGVVLRQCESLEGFAAVLLRAKGGERSARSELEFAAGLVQIGLSPELEPHFEGKRLDARFDFVGSDVFSEVIAPDQSDALEATELEMGALAQRLVQQNRGSEVEVLLSPSFDFAKSHELEEQMGGQSLG